MTEKEVTDIIDRIVKRLGSIYRFGYHSIEDMQQQGRLEAIKGIENYDGKRPLENFLWTHVRNRLHNYKRDNYQRHDKPCLKCPLKGYDASTGGCTIYSSLYNCELYNNWHKRNSPKKNLMCTADIDNIDDENESNMKTFDVADNIDTNSILAIIDKYLPLSMREDYLKIKFNYKVSKKRQDEIFDKIREILRDNDITDPEEETG